MEKTIEIPEGHEARIDGNKVILEPKESEDEKIRKFIIDCIDELRRANAENADFNGCCSEAISYLEKQKEQKPESCDCSRDEESYTNGIHHVLMNPEAYGLIKQKPAEQLGGTFTSYDMAKTFTEGQNYVIAHPEKFGLCKPAEWSEEDKHCIHQLILFCENCMQQDSEAIRCATWLKSLRPQPKQEWSEEDDALLKEIVSFFKDGTVKLQHDLDLYAGFLEKKFKSLRPQPHWKPSEEQMEALKDAFKAGAEWMAGQFQKIEGGLVDWYSSPEGKDYCYGVKTIDSFEVPEGFYIRKK